MMQVEQDDAGGRRLRWHDKINQMLPVEEDDCEKPCF